MIKVNLTTVSSSTEDPTPPSRKDCEVHQQLLLPPSGAKLETEKTFKRRLLSPPSPLPTFEPSC